MLSVGRTFAGDGWRYLWEQVAAGSEDYYLADVAGGEAPGRWCGSAARPELGLEGTVTEEQMHRVFGLLAHPSEPVVLGRAPRIYRSMDQRLDAARAAHDEHHRSEWMGRAVELAESRASSLQVDAERRAHEARAAEEWAESEAVIRRGGERHAVAGFDLTFSPPKSVSVLWAAADAEGREAIWRAHREGVTAALGYLEREAAWSRAGYNGIRQVDTSGWVVASFEHRMSRTGDVQIHTHNAVLNRVRCGDGEWRSVDGRDIYRAAASAGALYDRVREAALERDLGIRHEQRKPDGAREIVGVDDDVCRLFSSRRTQIEGRHAELVAAWRARGGGEEPSQWTIARLSQWATLETRSPKDRCESTEDALARWDGETRAHLRRSLADVWERSVGAASELSTGPGRRSAGGVAGERAENDEEVLAAAVDVVDAEKATWTRYDLARRLTLMLPNDLSLGGEGQLARVDALVERAVRARGGDLGVVDLSAPAVFETPAALRRVGDGDSVYEEHGATRYSTNAGLAAERAVLKAARDRGGGRLHLATVEASLTPSNSPTIRPPRCGSSPDPVGVWRPWWARRGPGRRTPCGPWRKRGGPRGERCSVWPCPRPLPGCSPTRPECGL
jgi:conjugative relaxase-like TrwC/TraI family protein